MIFWCQEFEFLISLIQLYQKMFFRISGNFFCFISESTSKMLIKPRRYTHAEIFSHTFLCFMWHGACHHGKCRASARFSECEVSQQKYLCHVTLRHFWQKNKNGSGSKMGLVAQRTYCGHTVVSFAWRPTESVFS